MATQRSSRDQTPKTRPDSDRIYDAFVAPMEATRIGQLIAVTAEGQYLLGNDEYELAKAAHAALGPGIFMFRIGPRAVHKMR